LSADYLAIFSRYPEAGRTKTRLIPALGAVGAAQLQRQMTERVLARARSLQQRQPGLVVELLFTGGSVAQMQAWLGPAVALQPQSEGDLGARLTAAFASAFARGFRRAIAIGTDCPDLDSALLLQAFAALADADLALGPALDGGYYLIGLRQLVPELFQGLDWGSERVLAQTLARAQAQGLASASLPPLGDVDRPEDLPLWYAQQTASEPSSRA